MCPACLTTVALTVASASSTGGLAALLARRLRAKTGPKKGPHPLEAGAKAAPESRAQGD